MTSIPGGRYEALENSDGTFSIKDVPIFVEHVVNEGKAKTEIGQAWMQAAIDRANERAAQDKYFAPLHIGHHEPGRKPERAGFVHPRSVVKQQYDGKERWVMLADLLSIPKAIFTRIMAGELPYRSVEILDIKDPEISSLALMDTEVPFFRLPHLTVGKIKRKQEAVRCAKEEAPALAYSVSGKALSVLYSEATMAEQNQEKTAQDGATKNEDTPESMMPMMQEMLSAISSKLDAILEALGGQAAAEEPGDESAAAPAEMAATEFKARIAALEGKLAQVEKERDAETLVKDAISALRGYALADGVENEIRSIARESGKKAVEHYVATVKQYAPKDPPETPEQEETEFAGLPAEVMAYREKGPDAIKKAIEHHQEFEALKGRTKLTLERYLAAQFAAGK